jgi:hypothetical protein
MLSRLSIGTAKPLPTPAHLVSIGDATTARMGYHRAIVRRAVTERDRESK